MRFTIRHRNFLVIDDFLEPSQFEFLHQNLTRLKYKPAGALQWSSIWSLSEPQAFRSTPFRSHEKQPPSPQHAGYAVFMRAMEGALAELEYLTGRKGEAWTHFTGNAVLHPPHRALNWHSDKKYAGSYSFYAQKEWQQRWAGELLIRETDPRRWTPDGDAAEDDVPPPVDGAGYFLSPIANRLVAMRGDTDHRIAAVSPAAGEHFRMSITGFFVKG